MKAPAGTADVRTDGRRVSLRPLRKADLVVIDAWFEESARAAFKDRAFEELRLLATGEASGVLVVKRAGEDEPIGLLEYAVIDGWLVTTFIALAKGHRGWGYGSEAVRLLEEWAAREVIATRFRAEVDLRNGLGLYFWLRLGYRPARKDEFGWQEEGEADRMAMVRVVGTAGAANAS